MNMGFNIFSKKIGSWRQKLPLQLKIAHVGGSQRRGSGGSLEQDSVLNLPFISLSFYCFLVCFSIRVPKESFRHFFPDCTPCTPPQLRNTLICRMYDVSVYVSLCICALYTKRARLIYVPQEPVFTPLRTFFCLLRIHGLGWSHWSMRSVHLLFEELTIMKTDHAGSRWSRSAHRQKTNQTNKKPWRNQVFFFFQDIQKQTKKSLITTLRWFYSLMPQSLRSY